MNPTERFTSRASWYARYRPGYPDAVVETLERECGLQPGMMVADIGAGTGISSALFLRRGYAVTAIEPNAEMRAYALALFGNNPAFWSLQRPGEDTGLPSASVDLVMCAQAFHWLREEEARREFRRIVRPGGAIALMWNLRKEEASLFMQELEALLRMHCDEYGLQADRKTPLAGMNERVFTWDDAIDRETFVGRMMSASYVPVENAQLIAGFEALFARHQHDGRVAMTYETRLAFEAAPL